MNIFAQRLKQLRIQHDLTQQDIGNLVGATNKAVSTWESGIKIPRPDKIKKLADYFNVTTDYLMGRTDIINYDKFDKWDAEIAPKIQKSDDFDKLLTSFGYHISKELYQSKDFYYKDEVDDDGNVVGTSKIPTDEHEITIIEKDDIVIRLSTDEFLKLHDDLSKIFDLSVQLNDDGRKIIINTLSGLLTSKQYNKKG